MLWVVTLGKSSHKQTIEVEAVEKFVDELTWYQIVHQIITDLFLQSCSFIFAIAMGM